MLFVSVQMLKNEELREFLNINRHYEYRDLNEETVKGQLNNILLVIRVSAGNIKQDLRRLIIDHLLLQIHK